MRRVTTFKPFLPFLSIILSAVLSSSTTTFAAACPALNFKVASAFPAGTNPRGLAVADFDADGNLDLAVANHGSNNVSVLRGDGAGRFALALNAPVGVKPYSVAAGDFNGDGRPDLVTADQGSASVSLLLNNGAGGFGAAAGMSVKASPRSVAVADFNADGKADVAVGSFSGYVSILLGAGGGNFAAPAETFITMSGVHNLVVGDFNGDGRADVFSLHGQSDEVSVLLGDGAGRFAAPKFSIGGSAAGSAAAADVNGDGKLDVVIAYSQPTSQGWAFLILGDGAGGFARPFKFDAGGNPLAAAVADFDGDGKPDAAIANDISSGVSVFSNVGAGTNTFAPARNYGVGTDPRALAVGDFNKDGRPDLASANYSSNDVSVMLNAGGGDFFANRSVPVVRSPWDSTAADFNGDGNLDFAVTNRGEGVISLMLGRDAGGLAPPVSISTPGAGTGWIAHADFNNDGKLDIAVTAGGALVSVLLGDGAGGFGAARTFSTGKGTGALACGDFNADGKTDIVVTLPGRYTIDRGGIAVLLGDGAGGFGAAHVQEAGIYPKDVAVGEFNGDGRADFVVLNDQSPTVLLFTPDVEGRYPFKVFDAGSDGGRVYMESVAVADFNADGKADVAAAASVRDSDSFVSVALGDGAGRLGPLNRHAVGPGYPHVTTGDFDGDGRLDVASANRSFEENNLAVLVGDGAGGFAPSLNFSVGRLSSSVASGDFDKDGRTDLAVVNSSAHDVSLIYNPCPAAPSNPVDDARFFVAQHYRDFLGREPDAGGLDFWTGGIESCGANQQCRTLKRIDTSAAFFLSIEFQETGFLVQRMYKAAFGEATGSAVINNTPTPIKVPVVRLSEFTPDSQRIAQDVIVGTPGWPERLKANKDAFALEFVQRPRFMTLYPSDMTPEAFVDKLNTNAGGVLSAGERQALVDELTANNNGAGRASVLRKLAEDADLAVMEKNKAFVLMQYFGYLRRNPNDPQDTDHGGYNFWLTKLDENGGDYHAAQMVFAFLDSIEYRDRFDK